MVIFDGLKKLSENFGRREAELFMCFVAKTDITGLVLNRSKELTKEQESLNTDIIKFWNNIIKSNYSKEHTKV